MVTEHAKICRDYTLRATPRSSTTGSPDSAELTLFASGGPAGMPTMTTSPLAFWRTNGDVPVEPPYDRGAPNVRAIWDDIADHIWRAINDADDGNQLHALYITGHSLGAAMAVIAAAIIFGDERYASWRPLVRGVYTYGQPMVGDPEFAESCDARFGKLVFRHIYDHDLVPRMPPWTTGPFRHFGAEYVGDASGWYPRSKPVRQAATALWSVPIGAAAFVVKQLPLLSW